MTGRLHAYPCTFSDSDADDNFVKMFSNERREMRKEQKEMRAVFLRENKRLEKEDENLKDKVKKQDQVIAELHEKLSRLEIKSANRQLDESLSQKLEAKIQNAIRRERHSLELKDLVKSEIKNSIVQKGQNDSLEIELKKLINTEINNFLTSKFGTLSNHIDLIYSLSMKFSV